MARKGSGNKGVLNLNEFGWGQCLGILLIRLESPLELRANLSKMHCV